MVNQKTIFAPATPAGRAGVAILRISGEQAEQALGALGVKKPLVARLAALHNLYNPHTGEKIDSALLLWFSAPHSFTGENILEIHHHGSRAVRSELLEVLSQVENFRLAEAGEFARRALTNGKLDLAEAEGLADLIDAETAAQKRQALRQMEGALSEISQNLRTDLISSRAWMEAHLDFPDEDIPPETYQALDAEVEVIQNKIKELLADGGRGEKIREGAYAILLGAPNVGKSTLLNALARREVAIVSDVAGTTRDVLEVSLDLNGYALTLADTAGMRENPDIIEAEGIRRALLKAEQADIKILMLDAAELATQARDLTQYDVVVINKIDVYSPDIVLEHDCIVRLSAKNQLGLDELVKILTGRLQALSGGSDPLITRARHREAFLHALAHLESFFNVAPPELKAEELRLAADAIGRITGAIGVEDVLGKIFSSFCIGK